MMKCGSDPYKPQGFLIEHIYETYRDTYIIFVSGIFFIAEIRCYALFWEI